MNEAVVFPEMHKNSPSPAAHRYAATLALRGTCRSDYHLRSVQSDPSACPCTENVISMPNLIASVSRPCVPATADGGGRCGAARGMRRSPRDYRLHSVIGNCGAECISSSVLRALRRAHINVNPALASSSSYTTQCICVDRRHARILSSNRKSRKKKQPCPTASPRSPRAGTRTRRTS